MPNISNGGGTEHLIEGGLTPIISGLADELDIRLETVVQSIDYSQPGRVVVTTPQETFSAPQCLVTVPLGVLKKGRIRFAPALPEQLQHGIETLNFGRFYKLALRFPHCFWERDIHWIGTVAEQSRDYGHGEHAMFVNMLPPLDQPALIMLADGDYAEKLETIGAEAAVELVMARLRMIYGSDIPEPEQYLSSKWICSPFTNGSYSYYGFGSSPADVAAFTEMQNGQLTFAGEHTLDKFHGTLHAAYLSGLQAAKRIAESLL